MKPVDINNRIYHVFMKLCIAFYMHNKHIIYKALQIFADVSIISSV
jgi:hypothetical protein